MTDVSTDAMHTYSASQLQSVANDHADGSAKAFDQKRRGNASWSILVTNRGCTLQVQCKCWSGTSVGTSIAL